MSVCGPCSSVVHQHSSLAVVVTIRHTSPADCGAPLLLALPLFYISHRPSPAMIVGGLCMDWMDWRPRERINTRGPAVGHAARPDIDRLTQLLAFIDPRTAKTPPLSITSTEISAGCRLRPTFPPYSTSTPQDEEI